MKRTVPKGPPDSDGASAASTASSSSIMSSSAILNRRVDRRKTPSPAICRFFVKYRCFVVPIGIFMLVHLILALTVAFLHCTDEDDLLGPKKSNSSTSSLTTLDLSTLGFTPECNISSREGVSAINRANTLKCKEQLAATACRIANDSLYPKRLSRQCFNNVTTYGKHLGCFRDDKKLRILPGSFTLLKERNSPLNCIDLCLQSGFQYAGVQYSVECFCGNDEPSSSLRLPSSECNMKCPKDTLSDAVSVSSCGGYFAVDVIETGILTGQNGKGNVVADYEPTEKDNNDKPVRVVFFLTLNGRALRQVYRLIKALFHEKHYFYIHVDARQDYLYRELLILTQKLPKNVRFMANRRATIWGGASLLTVLLNGMTDLIQNGREWKWEWDYIINLSESDFPLKTTSQLEHFLSANRGKNFLKSHGRDVQKFIQKQGLDKTFDECEYRMWRVGDRKLPAGILLDGGSDWIALHRDYVEYVVTSDDELVGGLKGVFQYTLLPAESFFHTLLRNSEMCDTFVDNNLHVTNWRRKLGCKCQYKNIVDWCGCSPNDFRLADWNKLKMTSSRLLFFGRKFEAIVNQAIINQLEDWLYPTRSEKIFSTLDRFWMSLYHHHDLSPPPDDALLTVGWALSRIAASRFLSKCISTGVESFTQRVDLIEITAYNHDDELQGILVKFKSGVSVGDGDDFEFSGEAWFKLEADVELAATNSMTEGFQGRIKDLKVGGEYEQKEQIFRNFAGSLGPFSEPTLAYSAESPEAFNITVAWIDPNGIVQAIANATVSEGTTANFVKPSLATPLTAGNWTLKIYANRHQVLYRVGFVIVPFEVRRGRMVSSSEQNISSQQNLQRQIDSLVKKQYTFMDFCLEKQVNHATLSRGSDAVISPNSIETLETSLCSHTQWSSFYPDPKSTIDGIDARTGLLVP